MEGVGGVLHDAVGFAGASCKENALTPLATPPCAGSVSRRGPRSRGLASAVNKVGLPLTTIFISINLSTNLSINLTD